MASHAKTRGPLSIATAFAYAVPAGVALATHHLVAAFAFALLVLGTLLFHATDNDSGLDGAGMLASLAVMAALPYGFTAEALGVVIGLGLQAHYRHELVALTVAPAAIVAVDHGAWPLVALALALLGGGFFVWRVPGDAPHAVWHVATAVAMTLIVIALA